MVILMVIQNKPARNSAIELLRIVAMLIIIAFHGHMHSWLDKLDLQQVPEVVTNNIYNVNILFSYFVGWGGDLGNTIFILITGYFMINRKVNYPKLILLLVTMLFYSWLIFIMVYVFMPQIYVTFTSKEILKGIAPILFGENWFVSCYIIFFCFVPYLNGFLKSLDKNKYLLLLLMVFVFFVLLPTVKIKTYFNSAEIVYFAFVYAIGVYIRLYFKDKINNEYHNKYRNICLLILLLTLISISTLEIIGIVTNKVVFIKQSQYFVKLFSIPLAVAMFLSFATMKPFFNRYVNIVAGTVLGIYLIHENIFLRRIIWDYILPNVDYIMSNWYVLFYIVKIVSIFIVGSVIDLLRKRYIEPLMVSIIDKKFGVVSEYIKIKVNKFNIFINK